MSELQLPHWAEDHHARTRKYDQLTRTATSVEDCKAIIDGFCDDLGLQEFDELDRWFFAYMNYPLTQTTRFRGYPHFSDENRGSTFSHALAVGLYLDTVFKLAGDLSGGHSMNREAYLTAMNGALLHDGEETFGEISTASQRAAKNGAKNECVEEGPEIGRELVEQMVLLALNEAMVEVGSVEVKSAFEHSNETYEQAMADIRDAAHVETQGYEGVRQAAAYVKNILLECYNDEDDSALPVVLEQNARAYLDAHKMVELDNNEVFWGKLVESCEKGQSVEQILFYGGVGHENGDCLSFDVTTSTEAVLTQTYGNKRLPQLFAMAETEAQKALAEAALRLNSLNAGLFIKRLPPVFDLRAFTNCSKYEEIPAVAANRPEHIGMMHLIHDHPDLAKQYGIDPSHIRKTGDLAARYLHVALNGGWQPELEGPESLIMTSQKLVTIQPPLNGNVGAGNHAPVIVVLPQGVEQILAAQKN